MPTSVCLTPRILQESLKTILEDVIGTYTYCDGDFSIPAISIGNPPNDVSVDGLEVIVPLFPDIKGFQAGCSNYQDQYWDIILIARTQSIAQLYEAVNILSRYFYCFNGTYQRQMDAVGEYESYTLTFRTEQLTDQTLGGLQIQINAANDI